MTSSSCLTLALIYGFIWSRQRDAWAHLLFAIAACATAILAWFDLAGIHAQSVPQYAAAIRWAHLWTWAVILALAGFVKLYLRAGRTWLLWLVCALRTASLFLDLRTGYYREITSLSHVPFLGESIAVAPFQPDPWMLVGQLSLLGLSIFVMDAALSVWRRGERRTAVIVGGSIMLFLLAGTGECVLVFWGNAPWPPTPSLFFLCIIVAMGYELGSDALRAAQLTEELRTSKQRMTLAAEAANMGFWSRESTGNRFWATDQWRVLFGFATTDTPRLDEVLQRIHPDDRDLTLRAFENAYHGDGRYQTEYRVALPNGQIRWIASSGRVELNSRGEPVRMRGVSLDITKRKQVELEAQTYRGEVAHLLRVATLGELSSSLAHELNQPLTAILHNAAAAQLYLAHDECDLQVIRDILRDIVTDDERAADVIGRLRTLVKKGEFQPQPLAVNELIQSVLKLVRHELMSREVRIVTEFSPGLEAIRGDRVQLQQVLINLILNAADAMPSTAGSVRTLTLRTSAVEIDAVTVSVVDTGNGILPGHEEKIFEPYYSTKPQGLGLGLSLSRSIILALGGSMWAEAGIPRGATIHFTVPKWRSELQSARVVPSNQAAIS